IWKMRDQGTAFFDTLMIEGWLSPRDIFDESSELWETPSTHGSNDMPPPKVVPAEPPPWLMSQDTEEATDEVPKELSIGNARPDWADNLDWDTPEQEANNATV